MRMKSLSVILSFVAALHFNADRLEAQENPTRLNRSLLLAGNYVREASERWIEERGCVSCHQIPTALWGFHSFNTKASTVDDESISKWTEWASDEVHFEEPSNVKTRIPTLLPFGTQYRHDGAVATRHPSRSQSGVAS